VRNSRISAHPTRFPATLVVDPNRHPHVQSVADLKGLVVGVQHGNTSQPLADRLVAERNAARVRVYAYDEIETALDDLSSGGCDAFMKLAPVTQWLVRDRPRLKVVETGITREELGICVRKGNEALRQTIGEAQAELIGQTSGKASLPRSSRNGWERGQRRLSGRREGKGQ
jgi:polar amino acid transport system substrate-binding protein